LADPLLADGLLTDARREARRAFGDRDPLVEPFPVVGLDDLDILLRAGTLMDLIVLIGLIDASDLAALAALAALGALGALVPADGLALAWVGALGRLGTFEGLGGLEVLTLQEALSVSRTRGRAGAWGRTAA
jgi:hypothetical protein